MRIRVVAGGLVLALSVLLAGCAAPAPAPTPTPTGFASEAEAFAAAEATYRAYVDALNQVDLADPSTFEPVFALTTGEANAADRVTFSRMHADSFSKSGDTRVLSVEGEDYQAVEGRLSSVACIDVASTELRDSGGSIVTNSERPPRYALKLVFDVNATVHLSQIMRIEDSECV